MVLFVLAASLPPHAARPAETASYDVEFAPSGDRELDDLIAAIAALAALRTEVPATGFALVQRARTDAERFEQALRASGYFDGTVAIAIDGRPLSDPDLVTMLEARAAAPPVKVAVSIVPGPRYRLGAVLIDGQPPRGPDLALGLAEGQEARAADILAAQNRLRAARREAGYPYAAVNLPPAVLHPDTNRLDVALEVENGPRAALGPITFSGLRTVTETYMRRRLTIRPGDPFRPTTLEAARRDLAAIGVFSSVRVLPAEQLDANGNLPVLIDLAERPLHAVELGGSWSTDLGFGATASWTHRNLFGGAEQLTFSGTLQPGDDTTKKPGYQVGVRYLDGDFLVRARSLELAVNALRESLPAYDQTALVGRVAVGRKLSPRWTISAGLTLGWHDIAQEGASRLYHLAAIPLSAKYDSTGNLLDPASGIRATVSIAPTQSLGSYARTFFVAQGAGSVYFDLTGEKRTIVALRGLVGEIFGADVFDLPPAERFYAGGTATVRGFRFQSIGPRFPSGRPTGGTSVRAGTIELRQRIVGNFGLAAFVDAGQIGTPSRPFGEPPRFGAGAGLRYHTSIGPIRLDFAIPLNRPSGGDRFEIYIGIGQAF